MAERKRMRADGRQRTSVRNACERWMVVVVVVVNLPNKGRMVVFE